MINDILNKVNPNREIKGSWINILVEYDSPDEGKYLQNHELYFDEKGDLFGITQNPSSMIGYDKEDYIGLLEMVIKDAKKHPIISYDEYLEIFNSPQ